MKAIFKREKGQSMVETALVLPFLILIVIGIIDFGWLFFNKLTIANCAREGARYASSYYCSLPESDTRQEDFETAVKTRLDGAYSTSDLVVDVSEPSGEYVTVTVSSNVPLLTPMFSVFFDGNTCHMESSVTMYVEQY